MLNPQRSLKEGYEITDVNTRIVFMFCSGVALLMFLGIMATLILLRSLEARDPINPVEASPLAGVGATPRFEGPHLQGNPLADRYRIEHAAEQRLHGYGLVSDEPGMERAHIPITRAMEKVAAGEAPYRQPVTVALEEGAEDISTTNNGAPEQSEPARE